MIVKEDLAWNPSICACEYDKECEIDCTRMKSLVDDLVIKYNEVVDTNLSTKNATIFLILRFVSYAWCY